MVRVWSLKQQDSGNREIVGWRSGPGTERGGGRRRRTTSSPARCRDQPQLRKWAPDQGIKARGALATKREECFGDENRRKGCYLLYDRTIGSNRQSKRRHVAALVQLRQQVGEAKPGSLRLVPMADAVGLGACSTLVRRESVVLRYSRWLHPKAELAS